MGKLTGARGTTISGARINDLFVMEAGRLTLNGLEKSYASPPTLKGEGGNDTYRTDDAHAAAFDGGKGFDTIDFSAVSVGVAVHNWGGTRAIYTGFALDWDRDDPYADPLDPDAYPVGGTMSAVPLYVERFIGTQSDDYFSIAVLEGATLEGRGGDDLLYGGGTGDVLIGGLDTLAEGQTDKDLLFGKGGSDRLTGGADADKFYFVTGEGNGHDVVTDFDPQEGDHLYIGQQSGHEVGTLQWRDHDANGDGINDSVRADFAGVSITLLGWSTSEADLAALASSYTIFSF